ncbi:hypothetical protein PF001_g23893 [Phytophthora fragariae]|uniref:Uncharacterized protein n=1 Tax=Phytophthora fragariae TaxID=53985 RepID=A0A6A4BZ66_9STRA|nr:hypothetical protein PF011_g26870 [Phytophthora fragariae]KAE9173669.1 hypothetical protein PF004_g26897 [Phytophthora fragariae]KAE9281177.1 hypothetical protein PF001_g23893 [Phytophthora fragariae]
MVQPAVSDSAEPAHVGDSAATGSASSAPLASSPADPAPASDPPAATDAAESNPRADTRSQVGSPPARLPMAPVPCNPSVWAPVMEVAFSSRFPDEPLFESPLELEEFFRARPTRRVRRLHPMLRWSQICRRLLDPSDLGSSSVPS